MLQLRPNKRYDREETPVIFVRGKNCPSLGCPKRECPHPRMYTIYAEWEGGLGHGWFCVLCGEVMQEG